MKLNRFLVSAVLLLMFMFASVPARAQNGAFAPYVTANVSGTSVGSVLSTTNPNYSFGLGVESSTKNFLLDINGQFSGGFAAVSGAVHNSGGYTLNLNGSAYYKTHGFLLGGGAFYAQQVAPGVTIQSTFSTLTATISNNRNQIRPYVGAGYQFKRDRIIVSYVLPGRDVTGANSTSATVVPVGSDKTVMFSNEIFTGSTGFRSHLRLTQNLSITTNNTFAQINSSGVVNFLSGATYVAGAGVKVVF
jgi:hypothetical protein